MRHNTLMIGCLGAALLTLPTGRAALADTPASNAAPAPAPATALPLTAPSSPVPHMDAGQAKPKLRADAIQAKHKLRVEAAQAKHKLRVKSAKAKPVPRTRAVPPKPVPRTRAVPPKPVPRTRAVPPKPVPHASLGQPKTAPFLKAARAKPARSAPHAPAPIHPTVVAAKPLPVPLSAVRTLPDYGGRDGIAGTAYAAQASPALNPLAQAWRAFEALAIVLALVVGGLYLLKRSGLIKPDGSAPRPAPLLAALPGFLKGAAQGKGTVPAPPPAANAQGSWVTMIGSQALPNAQGASLHLVSLGGKTLLLGVTGQSISLLSEVETDSPPPPAPLMDTGRVPASFDGFLMQADHSPQRQANETELLMNATTMRLQAMIARSETQVGSHRS